jgi:hypothetical protein
MPNKYKRKPKKTANKKAKSKPKKTNPTIVNRNVVNIRTDAGQPHSSGARIPVFHNDIFDTTPRIERPQDRTIDILEKQSKQLELFKTDLVKQQQANYLTLTDSVNQNLAVMNGELLTQNHYQLQQYKDDLQAQNQNQTALALYNDDLQAQEEEEDDKYFWDLKEQQKEQRLKDKEAKQNDDKMIMTENKLTDAQRAKLKQYASSNVNGDINNHKKVVKETDKIFDKAPEPKENDQIFGKDSIFMNDEPEVKVEAKAKAKPEERVQQKLQGKEVQCQYCNKVFTNNRGVDSHIKFKHPDKVTVEDVEDDDV